MSNDKPKILFYCQHSLGMGHLVRSLALAESLTDNFAVKFLNGGRLPGAFSVSPGIDFVNLPPLGFDESLGLVSGDPRLTAEDAQELRRKTILEIYGRENPAIVLIELFPFGRKKFAGELFPLLDAAKGKSKIVCSLRDILVGTRRDQERFETRAIETANRYFDAVLVHSDDGFARFEDSLKTNAKLEIPVIYTGFVVPDARPALAAEKPTKVKKVIVSAGGGFVGEELLRAAIAGHKAIAKTVAVETELVAGLFLPDEKFAALSSEIEGVEGLKLTRFLPDLRGAMAQADVSVSQCGYNTAFDILLSGVAAIVVPYSENGQDEQNIRARKLEEMNALRVVPSAELGRIAAEIKAAFDFKPSPVSFDLAGGRNSARILTKMLQNIDSNWLAPVEKALAAAAGDVNIFFRDDDAGIADERLFRLLDLFEKYELPIDLAVIPEAVTAEFAESLNTRIDDSDGRISVHQHGFAHINHQREGRKCEFGNERSPARQFADIAHGKARLEDLFGARLQPVFTPPWNRCNDATVLALAELGFVVLSRESKAKYLEMNGVGSVDVDVDWFAKRKGVPLGRVAVGEMIAAKIASAKPFGIMLHHGEMDTAEFAALEDLCRVLTSHRGVRFTSILGLAARRPEKVSVRAN